ncbi:LysM domain-containing protein [Dyella sp.]|jgi:tetratricopeptide (TPR) repeat protein|uniref:LysM peptidoglycan-binding domain-containing protein n=1 Tax=Dyella sp. TaxID=1869338 RepID=UPI002D79D448|nr:LysM domain-containing protein [Dyella sp.]HET6431190.1 LysM domain-containing protein [Dyella sp.]
MSFLFLRSLRSTRRPLCLTALACAALVLGGCASLGRGRHTQVVVTPAQPSAQAAADARAPSLSEIINGQLQHGRYAEGERNLRAYLVQHPDDSVAQLMLRQLTRPPDAWLGPPARQRVARPGDSYSTLAQQYLGDARLFVLLARYNDAADPSLLRVGETVRLPAAKEDAPPLAPVADEVASDDRTPPSTRPVAESRAQRALRLQRESLSLFDAGRQAEALARLDAALALEPGLAGNGPQSADLRQQLVAACHQRAIVLYRDQQLDPAIALWDRVLAIQPDYEPALAYRARAQELKRRLKQY